MVVDIDSFLKIRAIYGLKAIERSGTVVTESGLVRRDNPAEHSWSAMVLADYLMSRFSVEVDRLRVLELLMYHDFVEIKCGDVCISDTEGRRKKAQEEMVAALEFKEEFASGFGDKFYSLFLEFEAWESQEAKFAMMVDKFDAFLHCMDHKEEWAGWSKEKLFSYKVKYFEPFPEILELFYAIVEKLEKEDFFGK